MANQNSIPDLSNTAANNLNYKGQSIQGTALVSTIDSMFKNNASMLADLYDSLGGAQTAGGTATALTVTITEDWAALARGLRLNLKAPSAATGAATLAVTVPTAGALTAKAIRRQGDSAIQANDWVAGAHLELEYDDTYNSSAGAWVLLNPASSIPSPLGETAGGTGQTSYTQGDLLYASASNTLAKLAKGSTGQVLTQTSTIPAWGSSITLGTPTASTSGATIDYTGLPSWIRKITGSLGSVSTNGTSNIMIQIGDAGGVKTTGYLSEAQFSSTATAFTTGFGLVNSILAAGFASGSFTLTLLDATNFIWAMTGNVISESGVVFVSGGRATLTGALTRVRFTMVNGTDTFDSGSVNIAYE